MRRVVSCVSWLLVMAWVGRAAAAPAAESSALRQMAGVLEYIAGDYRGAVDDQGRVLHATEYEEQLSLAGEAEALGQRAGLDPDGPLSQRLAALRQALRARKPPAVVGKLCREARQVIVSAYGITLTPSSAPSRSEGAQLYAQSGCVTCHGPDGSAQTDAAAKLEPRPANFLDAGRMATVSPYRAFHALSSGVPGTAMVAYPQLSEAARWNLAFYVLSLRHAAVDLAAGKRALVTAAIAVPSAAELSALSEEDLTGMLGAIADGPQRAQALAYLRAEAPFVRAAASDASATDLGLARRHLRDGLTRYRDGDRPAARALFVAAYLDGFEPHEASLSVRDRELVREIERSMLGLRQAAASGAASERLASLVSECETLLVRAERGRSNPAAAFWGALTIALREGLEVALLIAALLGLVRKRGQAELTRYVHAGWALAVIAGAGTWLAAAEVISGMHRELAEGIAALLAAVVLLGVTHWLLGQLTAKRFMGFLADRLGSAASRSAALGVLGLSFMAVYREALEIVLFFQALLLDAGEARARVWLGAATGLGVLCAVAMMLKNLGQRLRPRPFMLLSSALLAGLSFALTGKGVRALQEAGVISITDVARMPELPWLGIWPTLEGSLAQGLVLILLALSALWPWLTQARTPPLPRPEDERPVPSR